MLVQVDLAHNALGNAIDTLLQGDPRLLDPKDKHELDSVRKDVERLMHTIKSYTR